MVNGVFGGFVRENILLAVKRYAAAHEGAEPGAQYVLRHPGRGAANAWRVLRTWKADESAGPAETLFDETETKMRQGGVALVREGAVARLHTVPALKTRW